jgi:glycosyltransferase involved in cell wall biosynthesis
MKERFPVSLVIPVYNESKTVTDLVRTIKVQTFRPAEVIFVDANSTDNTVELIESLNDPDLQLRVIKAGIKVMPGKGRNIGVLHAKTDWIAFTDAGIQLDKYWLENLKKKAEEDSDRDIIYGNFDPQVHSLFDKYSAITFVAGKKPGAIRGPFIASCLLKKKVWEEVGGFPDWRAAEDLIFIKKAEQAGFKTAFAPEAKVYWQLSPSIISAFKKFVLYSKYNVWAGWQADWHYGVARQYLFVLLIILLGIFLNRYCLLLLVVWIVARVGKRIYSHRHEFGIKEMFNPLTYLGVMLGTFTMDAGTFTGWIKAIFTKPVALSLKKEN